jgi:hypothetical protein
LISIFVIVKKNQQEFFNSTYVILKYVTMAKKKAREESGENPQERRVLGSSFYNYCDNSSHDCR